MFVIVKLFYFAGNIFLFQIITHKIYFKGSQREEIWAHRIIHTAQFCIRIMYLYICPSVNQPKKKKRKERKAQCRGMFSLGVYYEYCWTFVYSVSVELCFHFSSVSRSELLGNEETLIFWQVERRYYKVAAPFCIPGNNVYEIKFLHTITSFIITSYYWWRIVTLISEHWRLVMTNTGE